jgi:lipopolysaccharide export system protein LptC
MATAPTATLQIWEPRRLTSLAEARRRSGFVNLFRLAMIAGMAVTLGLALGHIVAHGLRVRFAEVPQNLSLSEVRMLNPRFSGRDEAGQPFELVAVAAIRRSTDVQLIDLESPIFTNATGTRVTADTGVFNRELNLLDLAGNVRVVDAEQNLFVTGTATYFMGEDRVVGLEAVQGRGQLGQIRADQFEVRGGGEEILLRDNVWTRLYSDRAGPVDMGPGPAEELPELAQDEPTR